MQTNKYESKYQFIPKKEKKKETFRRKSEIQSASLGTDCKKRSRNTQKMAV